MISLKRYVELHPGQVLDSTMAAYRAALAAIGRYGGEACPAVASNLQGGLARLQAALAGEPTPGLMAQSETKLEEELQRWGAGASEYYRGKTSEVKEIMLVLAQATEATASRDQRYASQFQDMTGRLQAAADLEDISAIRQSIVKSASVLKSCIDRMTEESQESIRQLQAKLSVFEARAEEADRIAACDELTGLGNRRYLEAQMDVLIARARPFSILLFDLNDFKRVNDTYGHLAGDDLLKQFGTELRAALRATDTVARWGGDEFVVLMECGLDAARKNLERVQKWVLGDYTIRLGGQTMKFPVTAAVGVAEWHPGENGAEIFQRADASMYRDKGHPPETKKASPVPGTPA